MTIDELEKQAQAFSEYLDSQADDLKKEFERKVKFLQAQADAFQAYIDMKFAELKEEVI